MTKHKGKLCPDGPGTRLKQSLKAWGFKERAGCDCNKYALEMNIMGPQWCWDHLDKIVDWLRNNAKERSLPFSAWFAKRFIRAAIRDYERDNMNLRKTFDRVFCINLDRRPDRWKRFQGNLPKDWPFAPVKKVQAIDGQKVQRPQWWRQGGGAWGCFRTHLRLIEQCLNNGVDSVLLMEDDALFPDDFTVRVRAFLEAVPDDWGMLYLGGQHLHVNNSPPIRVNDEVFIPYNVNRTHAFALRGKTMTEVYRHLCRNDWHNGNHIDHHLGRFHQRRDPEHPVYCPKEWLVGQAGGKSNISGRNPDDRFWAAAERLADVDPKNEPFVAVLGVHSSGSSCMAGVLYHLGLHLGNELTGFYGNRPDAGECGYEAVGLANLCETCIPFPSTELKVKRQKAWTLLMTWVNAKRREAYHRGTIAAGKYPQLCRLGNQLINATGDKLRVIDIERPLEDSIASLVKRTGKDPDVIEKHQRWLYAGKRNILERVPSEDQLTVNYYDLLSQTETEIRRVADFLQDRTGRELVDEVRLAKAVKNVHPHKQTIKGAGQ